MDEKVKERPRTKRRGGVLMKKGKLKESPNADNAPELIKSNPEPKSEESVGKSIGSAKLSPTDLQLLNKKPDVAPAFKKTAFNDRRSSYAGVTKHATKNNAFLSDQRSRRKSFDLRGKSETKVKLDQDKHMPANETLTKQQVLAFKEAFDLFDNNGGGTIDALELKETLESVGIMLDEAEIHDVMMRLDKDGNGEIDFEEFLDLMTNTEMFLEAFASRHDGSTDNYNRERDVLLFDALTEFMKKSALKEAHEIVGYYAKKYKKVVKSYNANKGAHVVGHYADGARLIGLTEKQIVQQLKKLQLCQNFENKGEKESPYAQPLQLSVLRSVTTTPNSRRRKNKQRPRKRPTLSSSANLKKESLHLHHQRFMDKLPTQSQLTRRPSSSDTNIQQFMKAKEPHTKHRIVLKIINNDLFHRGSMKSGSGSTKQDSKKKSTALNHHKDEVEEHKPGWLSQRNKMYNVVVTMPVKYSHVQVDHLPKLRKKVEQAKQKFSEEISKKKIQSNIRHYKELDSRRIPSTTLYEHFQRVFCAYSSAETNNRTCVSADQLKKASQHNNFHRRQPSQFPFYLSHSKKQY
nr:uncharacterized protein LOC100186906 isoform X1 [Ciona intestinalis]|eukprot:XP_002129913.1 uncharacterized protein LOC100186906 isoform X1 [Ciona intestinalis]